MKGRVNTGGGGSGGTITVTGVAGHTVTATKDGKTYTRTFNSGGVAVFKGLSTGTWTLTMTGDGQTATRTVDVNADYAITITYFSATISITYPAGSTCKATHTDGTVLNAPDTSGTWACVVPKSGTWTILAEDTSAGKSKSVNVSITAEAQSESVTLAYEWVLIDNGSVNTDITGEWAIDEYEVWASSATPASMTNESDHIAIYTGVGRNVAISHSTAIDVTNCKTLSIEVSAYQNRGTTVKVGLSTSNTGSDLAVSSGDLTTDDTKRTITLDVSSVSGNAYFKAVSGEKMNIKIYDLRIV